MQCPARIRRFAGRFDAAEAVRPQRAFSLQASADMFNIFNHPNFGSPVNYLSSPLFGHSTQTLNNYLGNGGQSGVLNPLYQIGGPRGRCNWRLSCSSKWLTARRSRSADATAVLR